MLKVYFGQWRDGRLKRLPYLGYYFLLIFLMMLLIGGVIMAAGAAESMMGMDIAAVQAMLVAKFGMVMIFAIFLFVIAMGIANINIMAKRIRDMGLPAWWTILGIIAVSILLNIFFPVQEVSVATAVVDNGGMPSASFAAHGTTAGWITQLYDMLIFLSLVLIPSDFFKKSVV